MLKRNNVSFATLTGVATSMGLMTLIACGGASKSDAEIETELLDAVFGTTGTDYKTWDTWKDSHTDLSSVKTSLAPHGTAVRVYVNSIGKSAETTFNDALPDGTIVVKENYKLAAADVTEY